MSYIRYSSYREALLARFATAIPMIITNWREMRDYDGNWNFTTLPGPGIYGLHYSYPTS